MGTFASIILDTAVEVPEAAAEQGDFLALEVDVPPQDQDQWCWCAITVGVSRFFDRTFSLSQCQTAAVVLSRNDACERQTDEDVNRTFALDDALRRFKRLARFEEQRLSFEQVKQQIRAGRPVGVRIRFVESGIAHFTLIRGYRTDPEPMLLIDDPAHGESEWRFDDFVESYKGDGIWRQSYLTQ
jgi:hypothetical protein